MTITPIRISAMERANTIVNLLVPCSIEINGEYHSYAAPIELLKGNKGDAFTYTDFTAEQLEALKGDTFTYADFTAEQLAALKGDKGDAFTYLDFNSEQLDALKGAQGEAFTYDDFTTEQLDNLREGITTTVEIKSTEAKIGNITLWGVQYDLFQMLVEIENNIPIIADTEATFTLSDIPLGFNLFLDIKSLVAGTDSRNVISDYYNQYYKIERIFVDTDLTTKVTIKCLENISVDLKINLQIQYIKGFGDMVELNLSVPIGIDPSTVNLTFPKLKYNKPNVASLTVDDSHSIWNNVFSVINKRWVDNEQYSFFDPTSGDREFIYHKDCSYQGYTKTNGYYPTKNLEYTDGAGVYHRFGVSVATWAWDLGLRDEIAGIFIPWVTAREVRFMQDFGNSFNYHDIHGIVTYAAAHEGSTDVSQELFNQYVKTDADAFLALTDRIPKILQGPNGDPNYIYLARLCPEMQYNMELANRGTDSVCSPFLPFNNIHLLDKKSEKYLVQRFFLQGDYTFEAWKNDIIQQGSVAESARKWTILGMHRPARDLTKYGIINALNDIEAAVGVSGDDSIWFPSIDEFYEYWFMTQYAQINKIIDGQNIKFKIWVPANKNFWYKSISCLLSGITELTGIDISSSENCPGTSCVINNNQLLVNLDFNTDLISKAEKYVSIFEETPTKEYAFEDAQYFVQMLKVGVKEPYQARITALSASPVLTSATINEGAISSTSIDVFITVISTNNPTEIILSENSDLSGASWVAYLSSNPFTLSTGFGNKTVYVQVKNIFGTSSIVSDSIEYVDIPLVLNSVSINSGAATTNAAIVNIGFNYTGNPTHYMISENLYFEGASWIDFIENPNFTLSNGWGEKTVYAKLKNISEETTYVSDTIELVDANALYLNSVILNSGNVETGSNIVEVTLNITGTATQYRIGETADLSALSWVDIPSGTLNFTLSEGYGSKTVYVQIKNDTNVSEVQNDSITVIQPVTMESIIINTGAVSTNDRIVSVGLVNIVGTPTHYKIGETADLSIEAWVAYIGTPINYQMTVDTGTKTVYVQIKNSVSQSAIRNDDIILEAAPVKATLSLLDTITNNTISYETLSDNRVVNKIRLNTYAGWGAKDMKSTTGDLLGWYVLLDRTVYYPINDDSSVTGPNLIYSSNFAPTLSGDTGVYPDILLATPFVFTAPNPPDGRKGRIVFTLPNGTYTFKIIMSGSSSNALTETYRQYCWYNIKASGTLKTPILVGTTGFTGVNNVDFNAEIDNIIVTDGGTAGNVTLYIYNDYATTLYYKPYINLIEITKIA